VVDDLSLEAAKRQWLSSLAVARHRGKRDELQRERLAPIVGALDQ